MAGGDLKADGLLLVISTLTLSLGTPPGGQLGYYRLGEAILAPPFPSLSQWEFNL